MDREQNTPDTSCENTASSPELERQDPQLPEEPQLEAATPLEDCDASYTAVLDGKQEQTASEEEKQDPSQRATDPGAPVTPQNQPPKKKSRTSTGTKLLIAFVAVMLALVILLTGFSSALAILLLASLPQSHEAPVPSTDEYF